MRRLVEKISGSKCSAVEPGPMAITAKPMTIIATDTAISTKLIGSSGNLLCLIFCVGCCAPVEFGLFLVNAILYNIRLWDYCLKSLS